jgi:hypothetical protein
MLSSIFHRLLNFYRDIGAVLYPVILDSQRLEDNVNSLLLSRILSGGEPDFGHDSLKPVFGQSISFLGLLFAVLASGYQFSDFPNDERSDGTHIYG